jgi:hypothetical protein
VRARPLARPLLLGVLAAAAALPNAAGGPTEARAAWEAARALRDAPWRDRARAYRRVVEEAHPTDRLRGRALRALGGVLRGAGHAHGAAAAEAWAAAAGPDRDDARLDAVLDHARAMRSEGDAAVATARLEEVLRLARADAPRLADQALDLRAEDAFDAGDDATLARLHATAERERAATPVRIRVAGRLGERRLALGDRAGAQRCLAAARAAVREAEREDDAAALAATRAWLDLPLRRALETS